MSVAVGTTAGEMKFVPNTLTFKRGNYYKLAISNPSPHAHYFTSDDFATHIFTRKIEVLDKQGETIAELHGSVNDIELKPGTHLEWFFFPMTKGQNLKLLCHKKGHEAQGMLGMHQHHRRFMSELWTEASGRILENCLIQSQPLKYFFGTPRVLSNSQ